MMYNLRLKNALRRSLPSLFGLWFRFGPTRDAVMYLKLGRMSQRSLRWKTSDSRPRPTRVADLTKGTATFEEVDIRSELYARPQRTPDYAAEHRAMTVLAAEMTVNPRNMLQKLVETAIDLCRADTAGISVLDGDVFRWEAMAGIFAAYRGSTMPRDASPCGVCVDQNATQLMHLPDRHFPALKSEPRFVET